MTATWPAAAGLACVTALSAAGLAQSLPPRTSMPAAPPANWVGLIGQYEAPAGMRLVLEDGGKLFFADTLRVEAELTPVGRNQFAINRRAVHELLGIDGDSGNAAAHVAFVRNASGRSTSAIIGHTAMPRLAVGPQPGSNQLHITPVRPVAELRREAMEASPPTETGPFRPSDLVELTSLDSTIKLEIRYATTNNFLGTRFYSKGRAFLQRPAAEAVVRANQALRTHGWGLLIHDAYRPWYVTKMFWDATPLDKRWLVANPAHGSMHNRGAAVDLTLFELATGKPVEMPSTYDESTGRAHADYPGGTSRQRWLRAVLRQAMEAQGFSVLADEWWHFDYKDWYDYAIGNVPFEQIGTPAP